MYRWVPPVNDVVRPGDVVDVPEVIEAGYLTSVLFWDNEGRIVPNSSVVGLPVSEGTGTVLKVFGVLLCGGP